MDMEILYHYYIKFKKNIHPMNVNSSAKFRIYNIKTARKCNRHLLNKYNILSIYLK